MLGSKSLRSTVVLAGLIAGLAASVVPSAAFAADPVDLSGAYVLDQVGVVTGDEDRIKDALDDLYDETGDQLFVVYVDSFEGSESWADQSADISQLGDDDILLAIARDDRLFQFSKLDSFRLSTAELDQVVDDYLIPELRNDNWADAAISFAEGIASTDAGSGDSGVAAPDGESDSGGSSFGWIALIVIVLAILGIIVFGIVRRNRKSPAAAGIVATGPTQKELDQQAGSVLVQLDDEVTSSEQELGFATAQFGEEATAPFTAAVASAKAKLHEAFTLRQRLDDSEPDTAEETRAWTLQIISLCEAADAELDAQADAFVALRELEKTAPAVVTEAEAAIAQVDVDGARAAVDTLEHRYAHAALATIASNPDQAASLVALTRESVAAARAAVAEGRTGEAAVAARTAQASVAQAKVLVAGVTSFEESLADATRRLDAEVTETKQDVAEATAAGSLASVVAPTEAAIAFAESPAGASDPVGSLSRLEKQASVLNEAMSGVRAQQAQVSRARGLLSSTMATAQAEIGAASDYLSTRRGGVGTDARTRLASARRQLEVATSLSGTDPVAALAAAEQAMSLAREASRLAQDDVDSFGGGSGGGYSGNDYSGTSYSGSSGADSDAFIGGLLGGLLGGGNRSSGGFFGGGGGGGGFFGGGSSGGGGFGGFGGSGGSFGGGRSGGGHSSGGRSGGHSGSGGRF